MLRLKALLSISLLLLSVASTGLAQDRGKIKLLTPTYQGSTGLFSTPFADTLRKGEFSFALHGYYVHREPGDLSLTVFPLSVTAGLTDRIEFFASYEIHKRVHAGQITPNTVFPGAPLTPTRLSSGVTSFYNDTPFLDLGFGSGPGEFSVGAKFNILSERRGDAFGLAFQPVVKFHLDASRSRLARGLSSGANDAGFDMIVSKDLARGGTFTVSSGLVFAGDPSSPGRLERQNEWNYAAGVGIPLGGSKVHFLGELVGTTFWGDRTLFGNPKAPLDVYVGLRGFPAKWLTLTGGYVGSVGPRIDDIFGVEGTDRHGAFGSVSFNRKINRPPSIDCSPTQTTITEGESATINADVFDEDDDIVNIDWTSSGGRLTQSGSSAVFNSTGLGPGRYTVKGEVTDGEMVASCSADITVQKRKQAPTISCEASGQTVTQGQSVTLNSTASDPNGDALTYGWTVNGQSVTNNSRTFEFGTAGRSPGRYTIKVTATDVDGMSDQCQFTVSVNETPNQCPSVRMNVIPTEVFAGQTVQASATASDPDNDPISFAWSLDGRSRSGSGSSLTINTSGLSGGSHTVKVTATDDRGCSRDASATFAVTDKTIIQMPLDNIGKAQLDEIALKLQQNPSLVAKVTGHTDDRGSESANQRTGLRRANRVKDYLVKERGISADRIEVHSGGEGSPIADNGTAEGRKKNRRVEVELSAR